ncbi:type VI secretion lipoprotein TssJ [Burkholderia seminalis]|uniref:type VI secretion lipoprotein TssJ n=1 Tax=Burkholderia seminalis TaxID=488731 RepID=UPI00264C9DB2|nr:type VI secretion lipoprotein TssJ [Burkholderia seminalis]MDN7592091.1 type VI secretion lipoprotein TssJ [Burkholderia seminalis]
MKAARTLIVALALGVLSGCSLFSSKTVEPRQLHVTLIGGSRLNAGANGEPRPIQTCIYVVRAPDWVPMATAGDSSCAGRDQEGAVVATSRHVIAPNQVLQFGLDVPRSGEIWLVADADYAQRPDQYAPLRVRIDGSGLIHVAVWLDRDGIYNALLPGPVPVARAVSAAPAPASAAGVAEKPVKRGASSKRRIRQ